MLDLLERHAATANAGEQHASILRELLATRGLRAPIVRATQLTGTAFFRELVASMGRDPEACVLAYNKAVASVPESGLAPLVFDTVQDRFELPLWKIRRGEPRVKVYAEHLPDIPPEQLAPRAILMTAVLRMVGCDLFVHGIGGGVYDRATDMWIRSWMPGRALAPTAVATSTRYLGFPPAQEAEPLARALWRAHHAKHDPAMLGDVAAAARKGDLVARIAAAKAAHADPTPLYREMVAVLERVRSEKATALATIARGAQRSRALASEAHIRLDRTWPFPLHDEASLRELEREVNARFGG